MYASHLILGRPQQLDSQVQHNNLTNRYSLQKNCLNYVLMPLLPIEKFEDAFSEEILDGLPPI